MECYYGIVEFSVSDKQQILLLWRISNDKKYVKVTNNFLQWYIVYCTVVLCISLTAYLYYDYM